MPYNGLSSFVEKTFIPVSAPFCADSLTTFCDASSSIGTEIPTSFTLMVNCLIDVEPFSLVANISKWWKVSVS